MTEAVAARRELPADCPQPVHSTSASERTDSFSAVSALSRSGTPSLMDSAALFPAASLESAAAASAVEEVASAAAVSEEVSELSAVSAAVEAAADVSASAAADVAAVLSSGLAISAAAAVSASLAASVSVEEGTAGASVAACGASDGAELVCAVPEQPAEVTAMAAARARAKDLFITEFENLIKIVSFLRAAGIYMGRCPQTCMNTQRIASRVPRVRCGSNPQSDFD